MHAILEWLRAPLKIHLSGAAGRQRRLLAWLLLVLLALTVFSLLLIFLPDPATFPRRSQYVPFIVGIDVLLVIAYCLNAAGRYALAAGTSVICAAVAPWGALLIDPAVLHGDVVPLAYATLSVLLCSILLPPVVTTSLSLLQFAGFAALSRVLINMPVNWPSLLALLLFASVLSIVISVINQDNLNELDRQTRELARRGDALRELSVRDHLTGLFNRRYLEETLDREIQRSSRAHRTIGIVLFDIDGFKQINDTEGHAAGDVVLQEVALAARGLIRGGDIACRYGGDEFVLVLPETTRQTTRQRGERLRVAIKQLQVQYHARLLEPITISAGIAIYPQHGSTREELLRAADKALYLGKQSGKDCVEMAASLNV